MWSKSMKLCSSINKHNEYSRKSNKLLRFSMLNIACSTPYLNHFLPTHFFKNLCVGSNRSKLQNDHSSGCSCSNYGCNLKGTTCAWNFTSKYVAYIKWFLWLHTYSSDFHTSSSTPCIRDTYGILLLWLLFWPFFSIYYKVTLQEQMVCVWATSASSWPFCEQPQINSCSIMNQPKAL